MSIADLFARKRVKPAPAEKSTQLHVVMIGLRGFPGVQGGVETHAEHLCPLLAELGCKVDVIVRSHYQPTAVGAAWHGVNLVRLWAPRSKSLEALVHSFLAVLYAACKRPDLLHIQAIGPSLMTPLARLLRLRVVVTHHGPDYERQKWGPLARLTLLAGERFGMRLSDDRIVISDVIRRVVLDRHRCESRLIPNGVDLPTIPASAEILQTFGLAPGRYVLLVSRLVPEKRHHDLVAAFAAARLAGWQLALVGGCDHPDPYARSVFQAGIDNADVVCTGFQSGAALQELYAHAGMFVLPSSHEGLPIALLEALSYGLPVIASDIAPHLEIACSDIRYFRVGDVADLAHAMKQQAGQQQDEDRRDRLRRFVLERYQWRDVARKTVAVYAGVAKTP